MTKRNAIIGLYRARTPISKIIKQLKVPKSTVYDGARRNKKLGNTKALALVVRKSASKPLERG